MYSCVFWCEFIDLVGFFFLSTNNSLKNPTKSMNSLQKTQKYIKSKSPKSILSKNR